MKKRQLGNAGLVTSELGFGCMGLKLSSWTCERSK